MPNDGQLELARARLTPDDGQLELAWVPDDKIRINGSVPARPETGYPLVD